MHKFWTISFKGLAPVDLKKLFYPLLLLCCCCVGLCWVIVGVLLLLKLEFQFNFDLLERLSQVFFRNFARGRHN